MFCLRRFTDNGANEYKNVPVANFEAIAEHVWHVKYEEPDDLQQHVKQVLYQVYPKEPNQTFYTMQKDKGLFVFLLGKDERLSCAGQTMHADQYLYFEMQKEKHVGCVLVAAGGLEEALRNAVAKQAFRNDE